MEGSRIPPVTDLQKAAQQELEIRQRPTAISVQNANKSYTNGVPVLKNFNMTVPQGTM
jgi:ABC-type transport system involved in cytochrome bd biosynthesis fused ATPase/permease subunit